MKHAFYFYSSLQTYPDLARLLISFVGIMYSVRCFWTILEIQEVFEDDLSFVFESASQYVLVDTTKYVNLINNVFYEKVEQRLNANIKFTTFLSINSCYILPKFIIWLSLISIQLDWPWLVSHKKCCLSSLRISNFCSNSYYRVNCDDEAIVHGERKDKQKFQWIFSV